MSTLKIGSLFSGIGGLDLAVEAHFDGRTVWHCEYDPKPSKVLAARWPGVPNLGDITTVDWSTVEPVDIVCGGSPCQDVSAAGPRTGMVDGTRSNLWVQMREAIAYLKPSVVIWENVRGALSAYAFSSVESEPGLLGEYGPDRPALRAAGRVVGDLSSLGYDAIWTTLPASDIGAPHTAAVERWEALTRPVPASTRPDGKGGRYRVSPLLPEWMMGYPLGWVTDIVDREAAIKACGNGVVPQQAIHALGTMWPRVVAHLGEAA